MDEMRGVNSYFTLKSLLVRGLVEKRDQDGKSSLYDITFDALRYLGVTDRKQLPSYDEFKEKLVHIREVFIHK